MAKRFIHLGIVLSLLAVLVQPPVVVAQGGEPPELYPCGEPSPPTVPGVPGGAADIPPLVITNDRPSAVTEGHLTDLGDLVEEGGLRVELDMPTGTLQPGVPYTFGIKLSRGSDWPWARGGTASPSNIIGKGASGLTVIADGDGVEFGEMLLAIDGRTIAEGRVDLFMNLVLVIDVLTLNVPHIIEGLVVHFVYDVSQEYLRSPEHSLTAAYRFDNPVTVSEKAALLTTCFGRTGSPEAMQDAGQIEFEVEITFQEPGLHTVTFFPDVRFWAVATTGDKITGSTTSMLIREYRRQLTIRVPVGTTGDAASGASSTVLVLDVSGSMSDPDQSGVPKIEAARNAAGNLLSMIQQENDSQLYNHRVGVVAFNDEASLQASLSTDVAAARQVVTGLAADGGTDIGAGLDTAIRSFIPLDPSAPLYIILMTDGKPQEGPQTVQEFLDGPVARALEGGICIYTVGFGTVDDLDEALLQAIAQGSGCGEYYYASDAYRLNVIYARLRHETSGVNVKTYQDWVAQDQLTRLGLYTVAPDQGLLDFTLLWPGSEVDLVVSDPRGQEVTEGYPGATFLEGAAMRRILVEDPTPGDWEVAAYGREVSEGTIQVDAIVSTQPATEPQVPDTDGGGLGVVVVLAVVAVAGLGVYTLTQVRRRRLVAEGVGVVSPAASLVILRGPGAGQRIPLTGAALTIGRSRDSALSLGGSSVSRRHAVIRYARGRYYLQDQGSTHGTYVNGQRIDAMALNPGDRITIGDTEFEFRLS